MRNKLAIDTIDIRDLLEELHIDYSESGKNVSHDWIGVQCPFCDDHSDHLGINLDSKVCSCFKCGKTTNVISYLATKLNNFNKAISLIESAIPRELKQRIKEEYKSNVDEVRLPSDARKGLSPEHKAYLKSRRFNPDLLTARFNLHSTGPNGFWKNRIIIPIVKHYQLVTFTSCSIEKETESRYIHLSNEKSIIHVKQLLFGSEYTNGYNIVVVEGLFDAWRFGSMGIPLWGVKFTDKQVQLLSKYQSIKIVGDGDKDGWNLNRKLSSALAPYSDVRYFDLQEGLDPDKLSKEEIQHIKRS